MGVKDKELIESRYGKLWSGLDMVSIGDKLMTLKDLLRAFDIWEDVVAIDVLELGEGTYAFRYYDGDDRCVAVLEFDSKFHLLVEHRAHIAEWLDNELYHGLGIKAFMPEEVVRLLRESCNDDESETKE